jgi:hypothetical protein
MRGLLVFGILNNLLLTVKPGMRFNVREAFRGQMSYNLSSETVT